VRPVLAFLAAATFALAGCGKVGPAPADRAAMAAVAQSAAASAAARQVGQITWYTPEDLHEYIDGMAPRYVEAGFRLLAHSEWRAAGADASATSPYVAADLYDMDAPEYARKVFEDPGAGSVTLPGGIEAYADPGLIEFPAGRYLVRVQARGKGQEALVRKLAEALAGALATAAGAPDAPGGGGR